MTTGTVAGLYVSYNVAVQSVRDLETAYIPDADTGLAVHRSGAHDRPVDSAHGVTAGPEAGASADADRGRSWHQSGGHPPTRPTDAIMRVAWSLRCSRRAHLS